MRLTESQKARIFSYRKQNLGYGEIAKRMGLLKSTVAGFCHRHELGGDRSGHVVYEQTPPSTPEADPKKDTTDGKIRRNKKDIRPIVTCVFAKEPNEQVIKDVMEMLIHASPAPRK